MNLIKQAVRGAVMLACVLTAYCTVVAGDFRVTRVVKIGPGDMVPLIGPVKWSPDGSQLSYFASGYLMISDTLGDARKVAKADGRPMAYEWLGDSAIVVFFRKKSASISFEDRVAEISLSTGQELIIDSATMLSDMTRPDIERGLRSLRLTRQGKVYYEEETGNEKRTKVLGRGTSLEAQAPVAAEDRILRWGNDALYLVSADLRDSTRLVDKPQGIGLLQPSMNSEGTLVAEGGRIWSLTGKSQIVLDTFPVQRPESTEVCGFIRPRFNPNKPLILYDYSCDDGERYIVDQLAVFDYVDHKLTFLDSVLGLRGCRSPCWSPDGLKFCFLANGNAYVAYWEE